MELGLTILLLLLLGISFYQDNKTRTVHLFVLLGIAVLSFLLMKGDVWAQMLMNLLFVCIVMSSLFIYVSLKQRRLVNIFQAHFGIGDFVFFIAIAPLFSNQNYILFFISGMVFSAILHLIRAKGKSDLTIPLAGYLSIYLSGLLIVDLLLNTELLHTDII
jgi:hypothetical protein